MEATPVQPGDEMPIPGVCPHCKSLDLEADGTGIDRCRTCDRLSRDGRRLKTAEQVGIDALRALDALKEHQAAAAERIARLEAFARRVITYAQVTDRNPTLHELARFAREALGE